MYIHIIIVLLQTFLIDCQAQNEGLSSFGLSSLDTIKFPPLNINLTEFEINGISGIIMLNNTMISGLSDLKLSDFKIGLIEESGIEIQAKVTFPAFDIITDYDCNFTVKYDIFGKGSLTHRMEELQFSFDVVLHLISARKIALSKFKLLPGVEAVKLDITGFFNDDQQSALLSQLVDEEASAWLNGKSEDIAGAIEEFILNFVNTDVIVSDTSFSTDNLYIIIEFILKKINEQLSFKQ